MHTILQSIAKAWIFPIVFMFNLAGQPLNHPVAKPVPVKNAPDYSLDISHIKNRLTALESSRPANLGSSSILPTSVALFSTSLQSAITSSASSMTLVSASYNNGASTLASSSYAFIIDEGTASQEFVIADCTATTCTNMNRGLSFLDGKTSVTSLKFSHRRGASVKITDAPILLLINGFMNNTVGIPAPISYDSSIATTSFTNTSNLVNKAYVDSIAIAGAGIINATTGARGIVALATGAQAGSTTASGSGPGGSSYVLSSQIATSTCQSTGNYAVITDNNGKINQNCLGSLSFSATTTFSGATSTVVMTATSSLKLGASSAYDIGKHMQIFTSSGTFIPLQGITRYKVEVIGGGGTGGVGANSGTGGGGGGGGGYCMGYPDLSATTSVQVVVGTAGVASNFGTYCSATSGSAGATNGVPGSYGAGSGPAGTLNLYGQGGGAGINITGAGTGGTGGNSFYGGGGKGGIPSIGSADSGQYGGGGGGTNSGTTAGTGGTGIVIVTW